MLHSISHGINKHNEHYQEKWCYAQGEGLTKFMSDEIVAGNSGDTWVVIGDWCTERKYSLHLLAAILCWSLLNKTLFVIKQVQIWVHSVSMQCKYVSSESITNNGRYRQKNLNCLDKDLSCIYLPTTNFMSIDMGLNLGLCCERLMTDWSVWSVYKYSACSTQRTLRIAIRKTNQLVLHRAVCRVG
jgi:hypothetical protein